MNINDRFKMVRLELKINQKEFGNKIGLSKSGISNIESGTRNVTDKHIKLICAIFHVNETWFRTGAGEMFQYNTENFLDDLAAKHRLTAKERIALSTFITLESDTRAAIMSYVDRLTKELAEYHTKTAAELMPQSLSQPEPTMSKEVDKQKNVHQHER